MQNGKKQKIVIIVGPTGVGKTDTSIYLAKSFNAEIISADSMQIYKNMNIGTAKITEIEMDGIKHHLLDIIEPTENYSVALWTKVAKEKIEQISKSKKNPFIVGGTGLYINSLIYNYDFYETTIDPIKRKKYYEIAENHGSEYLWNILNAKNPILAQKAEKNKTKAIVRYLEIADNKGDEIDYNLTPENQSLIYDFLIIGLNIEREKLYANINKRVDKMIDSGLIEEVRKLKKAGLSSTHQSALAIGYKEVFEYLEGKTTKEQMIELIKQHSRNYAKRQLTWFKRNKEIKWFNPIDKEKIKEEIENFYNK